ncbi:M48 family metallopeptidase [Streptomyces sp. NPDC014882]|uniref:M48 family metallopeptidase n=1 Tax=Streptomyces sp. NPDC014882 TaxID=3364927 RepID=UPI0036FF743D
MRGDARFTVWCAACDWNVDPQEPEAEEGFPARARRATAHRHGARLAADMASGGEPRARRDAAAVLAHVCAVLVHSVTLLVTVLGVRWIVSGWGGMPMVGGLLLLALAWSLRPRFGRPPQDGPVLHRADAPELFALVDDVAAVVGTRGVDTVVVDAGINAGVTTYGPRRRRLLTLGLPLWEVLTPAQRIALLGHELGHFGNGDVRHGALIGSAHRSLATWAYYLAPTRDPGPVQFVVGAVCFVPWLLVQGAILALDRLTSRATQRAEYLADRLAGRVASTEAAVQLMDRLLISGSAATVLRREVSRQARGGRGGRDADDRARGLWDRLAADMASVPESEYERLRRVGVRRGHSVDSTHPPTHLRRACLLATANTAPAVVVGADRARRIGAELADARLRVAREILRDGFPG